MSNRIVARRYALALLEEAERTGVLSAVDADIDMLRETLVTSPDLQRFLRSPVISREKKAAVVDRLLADRVQPLTLRFIRMMIDKEREDILPEIVSAYRERRDVQQGIVEASATLATSVSRGEQEQLQAAVEGLTGRKVRLSVRHDPGLIGGIVIRVGDTVYDGSVQHQLANLREHLRPGQRSVNGA